ncbi:hypothetical protein DL764_001744 [Monosporascus ibericus]|uniref:Fork-head domain-containing protein n=1 Tax=Monosporascus ibericus TaxID=155417 RepID=A0A4Q4TQU4_9PEZI|nr:hypothetical protein DL764_001744 [Monosporascus ibericus]
MHPDYYEGVPTSYSPPLMITDQRACTTQSTGGSTGVSSADSIYTPSPLLPPPETTQPPQQLSLPLPQAPLRQQVLGSFAFGTALQTYQHPQIHSVASAQGMWPTPPATSCDDFDNYSYNGSPISSTNYGIQPVPSCSTRSSVNSPRIWSSPDAPQLNLPPAAWKTADQFSTFPLIAAEAQHESAFQQQMQASSYAEAIYGGENLDNTDGATNQESPPMLTDVSEADGAFSPSDINSPQVTCHVGDNYQLMDDGDPAHFPGAASEGEDAAKADEPYAQLIYRAFMSTERHAMTLQDIYQWFRDNTDKTKGENKGWQNSIRHNLSMNAAFVKRDRKSTTGDAMNDVPETKKNTEWVLEDWAVTKGVQSTTRYRKGNNSRRGGSGHQRVHGNLSARASSGRKGGITASKTKAAATRKALVRGAQNSIFGIPNSHGDPMRDAVYDRSFGYQYSPSGKGEPVTPPDINADDILLPDPTNGAALSTAGHANLGYMYRSTLHHGQSHHDYSQHQQSPQQPHQHHNHPGTMYTLDDISGVYPGSLGPLSSSSGQGVSTTAPNNFDALFASPDEMSEDQLAYLPWGGSGTGGAYQS